MQIDKYLEIILKDNPYRITLSKPSDKMAEFHKIVILKKKNDYHIEKNTKTQVFHENIKSIDSYLYKNAISYIHINAFTTQHQYTIKTSKKGKVIFNKSNNISEKEDISSHNKEKKYLLPEGLKIEPLIDIGILNQDGKVIKSMFNKFKQINRFIEIIDDSIKKTDKKELNILDFGCGKSYLTFILYYYLVNIKGIKTNMIGLDLKDSVIDDCNNIAEKYDYKSLHFEVGDINLYSFDRKIDIVICLHACDTATDYALYSAIKNDVDMIFAVPCCQHELNTQISSDSLNILTRHGIVKERISALFTDVIRSNLLECCSYKSQMLEFVDISHTPKNILIRAVKTNVSAKRKLLAQIEAENLMKEFKLSPTLYNLLVQNNYIKAIDDKNLCLPILKNGQ